MYRIYGRRGTASFIVEAVLAEAGEPYEVIDVPRVGQGPPPPGFLELSPLYQVPVLAMPSGEVMTESAAIAIHLADAYPQAGLAPPVGSPARIAYLRWMLFMATQIYTTNLRVYYPDRYTTAPGGGAQVKQAALRRLAQEWQVLAQALGARSFLAGDSLTVADLYAAMLATWNLDVPAFFAAHPNIKGLCERVASRPRIAPIWERHSEP
jgi:glutathione S-transferase